MATDIFVDIKDVKGESSDKDFKDKIEVLSFGYGVVQPASAVVSSSGGGSAGRANFQDVSLTKYVDLASPVLFKLCAQGKHIDTISIHFRRAGGDKPVTYYKYEFEDCIITSVSRSGSNADDVPVENISFNFAKVVETYTQQKRKGGQGGGNVAAGWDLNKNTAV